MINLILVYLILMNCFIKLKCFVNRFHHNINTFKQIHTTSSQKLNKKIRIVTFLLRDDNERVDDSILTSAFERLKIVDLKEVIKKFGTKPKSLKKQELVLQCIDLYRQNSSTTFPTLIEDKEVISKVVEIEDVHLSDQANLSISTIKAKKVRSLNPLPVTNTLTTTATTQASIATHSTEQQCRSIHQNFPIGEDRNSRLTNTSTSSDMELIFLGTASCTPSTSRGVSAIALRFHPHSAKSQMWLFDCGESTQLQLQKSVISASKINKIFITHTHGDHLFGLGGTLCMLGQASLAERGKSKLTGQAFEPIEIFGPEGIRRYLRTVIQMTYSKVAVPHIIHELKDIPYLHGRFAKKPYYFEEPPSLHNPTYGEVQQGRNIYPDANGVYNLVDDPEISVKAAPMEHTIPCVGYVIQEKEKVGRLREDVALKLVVQHKLHLKTMSVLKALKQNETFTLPDGSSVRGIDVVEPSLPGRKVVILGDTCESSAIATIAQDATVLVHEATNSHFPELDKNAASSYRNLENETFKNGHSTPQMAGRFANRINAKRLVLSHFSPRYSGDSGERSMRIMWEIEDMARKTATNLTQPNDVIAAWDQMSFFV